MTEREFLTTQIKKFETISNELLDGEISKAKFALKWAEIQMAMYGFMELQYYKLENELKDDTE